MRRKPPLERCSEPVCKGESSAAMECEQSAEDLIPQQADISTSAAIVSAQHSYAVRSPKKLSGHVDNLVQRLQEKRTALRNTRRREVRLLGRIGELMKRLKRLQLLNSHAEELLDVYKDIPLHVLSGKSGRQFTDDQKQFAITLHYYSPAAYNYVRRQFKLLPCPRTIRGWLSSFDGSPGMTEQSFETIAQKVNANDRDSWSYKLCALHVDEMELKKQLEVDRTTGKLYGFTDIGSGWLCNIVSTGSSDLQGTRLNLNWCSKCRQLNKNAWKTLQRCPDLLVVGRGLAARPFPKNFTPALGPAGLGLQQIGPKFQSPWWKIFWLRPCIYNCRKCYWHRTGDCILNVFSLSSLISVCQSNPAYLFSVYVMQVNDNSFMHSA